MKIKTFVLLSIIAVLLFGVASAYDSSNPYTTTLRWIVPNDTAFSVSLPGGGTMIIFQDNISNASSKMVQPNNQSTGASQPIINISNDGNTALNFSCNLTAAKPTWATIIASNTSTFADGKEFNVTAVNISVNIAVSNYTDLYLWTNLTNATQGTTDRTFRISSWIYT